MADDPYPPDDMLYYAIANGVEWMEKRIRAALDSDDTEHKLLKLTPEQRYAICREAAKKVSGGDISPYIDKTMPPLGKEAIQYYDNRLVANDVFKEVESLVEQAQPAAKPEGLTLLDRFDVDLFFSRGRRARMEDRHVVLEDVNGMMELPAKSDPQAFFAVYDGHGGFEAARYLQAHLHHDLVANEHFHTDPRKALHETFLSTDKTFLVRAEREAVQAGATAVVAFIRGTKLYVAWAGDSQAMLIKKGEPHHLTEPHKPEREDEKQRVADAGGIVICRGGTWRVNAMLAVSRAFGDQKLKDCVPALPDIAEVDLDQDCEYLILACDGLWDFMEKEKVVKFIQDWEKEHSESDGIYGMSKSLVEHCIDTHEGTDNVTIIVIKLKNLDKDIWTSPPK